MAKTTKTTTTKPAANVRIENECLIIAVPLETPRVSKQGKGKTFIHAHMSGRLPVTLKNAEGDFQPKVNVLLTTPRPSAYDES